MDNILTVLDPAADPGEPFQYGSTWIRIRNTSVADPNRLCSDSDRDPASNVHSDQVPEPYGIQKRSDRVPAEIFQIIFKLKLLT